MATKSIKTVQLAKEWKDKNCPVCLDHFTAVIRQPIQCAYCPHATCRQCCSRYLLTTMNDPHCMDCKREWNREFIDKKLTQTFRKGPLKQHRRKVLMDRERGRLPAMQIYVEARLEQSKVTAERAVVYAEWSRVRKERKRIQADHNPETETLQELQAKVKPHDLKLLELDTQIKVLDARQRKVHMILYGKEKPEARQFVMKCPAESCRGFLSQAWKCGTCQKHFCSDCHAEKAGHKDEEHTCNADAKATASMIRNETHPCPKCGIRISKIDGCDQMWCVECHTTFSWNTGQILQNTVVHNPHYYEYLRRQNGGAVPREAGDVPCGGLPQNWLFTRAILETPGIGQEERTKILDIHRGLSDIQYARLPHYPLRQQANVNQEHDIQYLMNNLDEEAWGTALERTETNFERRREIGLILQTLLHVGSEKLTGLYNATTKERGKLAGPFLKEMEDVMKYSNDSLVQKGVEMGIVVPQITDEWRWKTMSRAEMKKKGAKEVDDTTAEAPAAPGVAEEPPAAAAAPEENANTVMQPTRLQRAEERRQRLRELMRARIAARPAVAGAEEDTDQEASAEEAPAEELIQVDLGGELIEMTLEQARAILGHA